jgi:ABC-type polysaccharide/polyol phosphate export permease
MIALVRDTAALFAMHNASVPLLLWLLLTPMHVAGIVEALPGLLVFIVCTFGLALVLGALATRYRDIKPIIESSLTLAFLSSPVVWTPEMVNRGSTVMRLNPLTHLFAIWREPLATGHVPTTSVGYVLACLAALALAAVVTFRHLGKAAFWI